MSEMSDVLSPRAFLTRHRSADGEPIEASILVVSVPEYLTSFPTVQAQVRRTLSEYYLSEVPGLE